MGHPVKISELPRYISSLQENNDFQKQFQAIPSGEAAPVTIGKSPAALKKNRYKKTFPYDHSRVKLNIDEKEGTGAAEDYINACFVKSDNGKVYIATQAPLLNTLADFWRMVWEQDSPTVVMLANLIDHGKVNCDKYWPDEESCVYGDITVTVDHEEKCPSYVKRIMLLRLGDKSKPVQHYQFTGWPDMGVPASCTGLLVMREQVSQSYDKTRGPLLLHCSAGVGRTGTYLAIDYLLEEVQQSNTVDVMKCIANLRSYRMNLVETVTQYKFIHHVLLEAVELGSTVSLSCDQLLQHYTKNHEVHESDISKQYQMLQIRQETTVADQCMLTLKKENLEKNRSLQILPKDTVRAYWSDGDTLQSGYINAVHIQSAEEVFTQRVTQMPLQPTMFNFRKLVFDHEVTSIVMLNTAFDYLFYTPVKEHGVLNVDGMFYIKNRTALYGDMITSDLIVKQCRAKSEKHIRHFQVSNWEKDIAAEKILFVLVTRGKEEVNKREMTVLVHCLNGFNRSGVFCAVSQINYTVDTQSQVDMFNFVKEIRKSKPEFITSDEQYQYALNVVAAYLLRLQ